MREYGTIISIALILFVIRGGAEGGWKMGKKGVKGDRRCPGLPELKLINGERKINGAENTTSPALILARQSGNEGFPRGACRKKSFQLRFSPSVRSANRHETLKRERKGDVRSR